MPYVDKPTKTRLDAGTKIPEMRTPGELNYTLTRVCLAYVYQREKTSYGLLNEVMGALTGAAQEFYRRLVAPYEDAKIQENGDVY